MANWVEQQLEVIGPKADIDRFCALAVTGNFRRDHTLDDEPTFRFDLACPIRPEDAAECDEEHRQAVLFRFVRSRVQARFEMQSTWDHPRHFYTVRLARDWPSLQFWCALNEDMGSFGGLVAGIGGEVIDLVADYDESYNRRTHRRRMGKIYDRWNAIKTSDRLWVVQLPLTFAARRVYRADATFGNFGTVLQFRSEPEVRRFLRGRTAALVTRRSARSGTLRRVSALCVGRVD